MAGNGTFALRILIDPDPGALAGHIRGFPKSFRDLRPVWRKVVPALAKGIDMNIRNRGSGIEDSIWARSNPKYLMRKQREGFGTADLVVSGRTKETVTSPVKGVLSMKPRALRFGIIADHVQALQFGSTKNKSKPKNFMGWNREMTTTALDEMDSHVRAVTKRAQDFISSLPESKQAEARAFRKFTRG